MIIEPGEMLPVCTDTGFNQGLAKKEKHYYMALVHSTSGLIKVFAMRTGTRNIPEGHKLPYWFDELKDSEIRAEMQQKTWQVMLMARRCYNTRQLKHQLLHSNCFHF